MLSTDLVATTFDTSANQLRMTYDVVGDNAPAFDIGVYKSSDGSTLDTLLMTYEVTDANKRTGSPSGEEHSVYFDAYFNDTEDDYYLVAVLDVNSEVSETDEDNNQDKLDLGVFDAEETSGAMVLHVHGYDQGESITIQVSSYGIQAKRGGVWWGSLLSWYGAEAHVRAHDGNDTVEVFDGAQDRDVDLLAFGGEGDDNISGDVGSDTIYGGLGIDELNGGGAGDLIYGGANNDEITGGAGSDTLYGDTGDDEIDGQDGNDTIYGGSGHDDLLGGNHDDEMHGGDGDDELWGALGSDEMYGDADDDELWGNDGDDDDYDGDVGDEMWGGTGNDELQGMGGADEIHGGSGDDRIEGWGGSDLIYGDSGHDTIRGGKPYTADSGDTIYGGSGNDRIDGHNGADTIYGQGGNDEIYGGDGDDYIRGGDGQDDLFGEVGDDDIEGESGYDLIDGQIPDEYPDNTWNVYPTVDLLADIDGGGADGTYGSGDQREENGFYGGLFVDPDAQGRTRMDLSVTGGLTADDTPFYPTGSYLYLSNSNTTNLRIYTQQTGGTPLGATTNWLIGTDDIPSVLWLEGVEDEGQPEGQQGGQAELRLGIYQAMSHRPLIDYLRVTIPDPDEE